MKNDPEQDFIAVVNKEELNCAACGECRMVCPVYAVSGLERNVARGRLALAKAVADGKLELTETIAESFENCLLCMACVENCAGHVNMIEVVLKSRAYLSSKKGLPKVQTLAFKALASDRKYQNMGVAAARAAQSVFMSKLPETSGLRLKLSLPKFEEFRQRLLPALAEKPFIGSRDTVYAAGRQKQGVLLFVGCAGNYIYTKIARETVYLLNRFGIGVTVLSGQCCCGAPVQALADTKTLKKLAAKNVRCFSRLLNQPIITICSSGGLMLKKHYPGILGGTALEARALDISRRTKDISEFLVDQVGIDEVKSKVKRKIVQTLTYHDPCHLGRGQQVISQPRALLQAVCEDYAEMPDARECCGLGGTYGFRHPKMSQQILVKKIKTISGMERVPAILATGCPGCIMQLAHGLYNMHVKMEVGHIVQYLSQALV